VVGGAAVNNGGASLFFGEPYPRVSRCSGFEAQKQVRGMGDGREESPPDDEIDRLCALGSRAQMSNRVISTVA
jgi:hypothetical protein